ncbi:MAG: 50S ribosomal protein L3 N(5)-glutamine methyltransferase [Succinivibrio sp.]|nr:50S ribosomal protein L3 N(5)-glutamine methyltransferase [Succinivibrio sp.]
MSKLSENSEIAAIYRSIDDPPTSSEIEEALQDELFTVQDVVRYLVTCFSAYRIYVGHGTDNYWDEALEIVQAVMHLQPPCDDSTLTSRLTAEERALIARIVRLRVVERIPAPYLTHRAFFCGHEFYVDSRVIIPRSPIAELVDDGFAPYLEREPQRVLDLCCGSACIAVAIALKFDGDCEVDAVDVDEEALEVARLNIEEYGLEDVVTPIKSDLFSALPRGDKYDLIVANPPYVSEEELNDLPREFTYEPDLALGSGRDGLNCAKRILAEAAEFLDDEGILVMEVGNSEEQLQDAFSMVPFHFVDLKRGGCGVFVLSCEQLKAYHELFEQSVANL